MSWKARSMPFVEQLQRAVPGAVVVRVVVLVRREPLRHAVDRGRGGRDDPLDAVTHAEIEQIEGGVGHDLEAEPAARRRSG